MTQSAAEKAERAWIKGLSEAKRRYLQGPYKQANSIRWRRITPFSHLKSSPEEKGEE
jgi:hypothetical protein